MLDRLKNMNFDTEKRIAMAVFILPLMVAVGVVMVIEKNLKRLWKVVYFPGGYDIITSKSKHH